MDARIYLAMGVTLRSCLRIVLEKPPDLDADHPVDLSSTCGWHWGRET